MAKYTIEDTTLIAIADSIRAKTGNADTITPENMPKEIESIETGGGTEEIENIIDESGVLDSTEGTATEKVEQLIDKAQWEKFWYEQSGKWTTQFNSLFKQCQEKKLPLLNYENCAGIGYFIHNSAIENIDYYIVAPKLLTVANMFTGSKNLKTMVGVDTSNVTNAYYFFYNSAIETIQTPFNFAKVTDTTNAFGNCSELKNIRFVAETIKVSIVFNSSYLSAESIQSIFGGLNSEVTGQTLTIPRTAVKKAFETSEGANDGDTSAAWSELVASKPNWTITLS